MIYGYCRVSTPKQKIDRQVENILREYPDAILIKEAYSGRQIDRPEWNKLRKRVHKGDTIIFDEVSRMSRNADDGIIVYQDLFEADIELRFLKEPHINTETYRNALNNTVAMTGTEVDFILEGINKYLMALAREQIRLAFTQAEKEVAFLRRRTVEGLRQAKANGVQLGNPVGSTYSTKKSRAAKEIIAKHAKAFGGSLDDPDVIKLCGCSRNSYYKYKRELVLEREHFINHSTLINKS